jgi:hypothetical protein
MVDNPARRRVLIHRRRSAARGRRGSGQEALCGGSRWSRRPEPLPFSTEWSRERRRRARVCIDKLGILHELSGRVLAFLSLVAVSALGGDFDAFPNGGKVRSAFAIHVGYKLRWDLVAV